MSKRILMKIHLKFLFLFCVFAVSIAFSKDCYSNNSEQSSSVVKIFVMSMRPNFMYPWQSHGLSNSTGSGSIISGKRILTNAHVVSDQTFIQVKKSADSKKYTARVEAIAHECDLALLSVEDESFFEGTKPLTFYESLPDLQDTVTVLGYPRGGGKLSITEGVVSRIEIVSYSQSGRDLLAVQIDAAINPGNSGGPVLKDGKIIGVAMQALRSGQNIGYMIPIVIVEHLFKDLVDGKYDGFPILGIDFDNTENPTLRDYFKVNDNKGGVLISNVLPFSAAEGHIKPGDIVLEIDETPIGEDGTFLFRGNERLLFSYLITKKQIGESLNVKLVRKGRIKDISFPLKKFKNLVPYPNYYKRPSYYIVGGLVFTILSVDLLKSWGDRWWDKAPLGFTYYLMGQGQLNKNRKQELVVLLKILSDDINVGYENYVNSIVEKVGNKEIKDFKDFVVSLEKEINKDKYIIIELEGDYKIILDSKQIRQNDKEILKRNNIPYQYSDDVKEFL